MDIWIIFESKNNFLIFVVYTQVVGYEIEKFIVRSFKSFSRYMYFTDKITAIQM